MIKQLMKNISYTNFHIFSLIIMWCVYMYINVSNQFFLTLTSWSPPTPPPPFEKFSRYDLQPITEQQDLTALLNPVISFFMSLEWWHEQMTFHLRVKQVYIYKTHCTFLWVVNEMFGGKKWRWRSSTSPPPTFWLGHIH